MSKRVEAEVKYCIVCTQTLCALFDECLFCFLFLCKLIMTLLFVLFYC
jgi:hypothetical protein